MYLLLLGVELYVPLKLVVSDLRNPIKNQEVPHCRWKESVPMLGSGACLFFVLVVFAALDMFALWNKLMR